MSQLAEHVMLRDLNHVDRRRDYPPASKPASPSIETTAVLLRAQSIHKNLFSRTILSHVICDRRHPILGMPSRNAWSYSCAPHQSFELLYRKVNEDLPFSFRNFIFHLCQIIDFPYVFEGISAVGKILLNLPIPGPTIHTESINKSNLIICDSQLV